MMVIKPLNMIFVLKNPKLSNQNKVFNTQGWFCRTKKIPSQSEHCIQWRFYFYSYLNDISLFTLTKNSKNFRTRSEQIIKGPFRKGEIIVAIVIDFQLFYFLIRIIPVY
jgi:hypothetical protein